MKTWKRMLALLLSLVLVVSLCACRPDGQTDSSESPDPSVSPDPTAAPSIEVDLDQDIIAFSTGLSRDDTLLTVNGEDIPADLFLYWLFWDCYYEYSYYYYYYYGYTVDMMAGALLEDAVSMALYRTVLRQKAAELGCLPTDAQMQEVKDQLLSNGQEYYNSMKAAYGLSDESVDYIFTLYDYYENLLYAVTLAPSEQELEEYLDAQGAFYVKHILLKTVDDSYEPLPDDAAAEKKALADGLLARLRAVEGEEQRSLFDELMNQYSEDGRDENGDLYSPDGYVFTDYDSLVDGFREAALELEEGQLSGIVETDYGYHIMLRMAFADIPDAMKEPYRMEIRQEDLDSLMEEWTEPVEVVRAPALEELDVAAFFDRYTAYQNALYYQQLAEEDAGD